MFAEFGVWLDSIENILWSFLGVPIVILLGSYLTIQSRFFQVRALPRVIKHFCRLLSHSNTHSSGVHPLKAFFAAVGGCVGIGNIVGVCTAVQLGGPGALFWLWMTALCGMLLKYSEVFLGMRYRTQQPDGSYRGGPMYFLTALFRGTWLPSIVCVLLCIYGVEVYQFRVITTSLSENFGWHPYLVTGVLLLLVLFAGSGGVKRVGTISSTSLPVFVLLYVGMGTWALLHHLDTIPFVLHQVFVSAFTGHAAVGGFVGATLLTTMSYGIRRGCYTGDVGVGYASVIHSETSLQQPEQQASLAIFDIFLDTFVVCTTSLLLILVTDVWKEPLEAGQLVQTALSHYFPYMNLFMPFFLFLLGYNTINAYFCVGMKCAEHLSPKMGKSLYIVYTVAALLTFSFLGTGEAQAAMAIAGVLLLIINGWAIFCLRHQLVFALEPATVRSQNALAYPNAS